MASRMRLINTLSESPDSKFKYVGFLVKFLTAAAASTITAFELKCLFMFAKMKLPS
jgi:hypothetical protein